MSTAASTDPDAAPAPEAAAAPGPVAQALAPLKEVFKHRNLRRLQMALLGSLIGDWAYATAVTEWAYSVDGARAVGLWFAIRLLVMAVTAPLASAFADKMNRKYVMITADVTRCLLVSAAALCISAGTPAIAVFVLATLAGMFGSVFRPAQQAWTPALADRPEQLTASNGVASTFESLSFFIGPALGATLVASTSVQTVFYLNAATFIWSALLVSSIHPRPPERTEPTVSGGDSALAGASESAGDAADDADDADDSEKALVVIAAGFREIVRSHDLRYVAVMVCAQTVIAGAAPVLWVVFAVHILNTGPKGVGYIDAVLGIGAIIGGFVAIARSAKNKLAVDLTVGVALWSLPLLLVAASETRAAVFVAAAILGFANPLVDVNFATAVQRIAPDRVLGRVFGALEGMLIATMALGAAVAPFLIEGPGLRATLVLLAVVIGAPAVLALPMARAIDHRLRAPEGLELLRARSIFAALSPAQLDNLARQLSRRVVAAGTVIVAEGDVGDNFYIIESGRVRVTHGTETIREEGAGEYFGEIALLRDVPRTATVTALEDTVLRGLTRTQFLDAVSGNDETAKAVDDVVVYRMRF
jgi:MFS family permease